MAVGIALLGACGGGDTTAPPTVESVSVSLASSSLTVGATTTASAVARDAQGTALTGRTPSWTTSNSAVATVSGAGLVSAVAEGTAQIIATVDGRSGQATLTVTPVPAASVLVTLASTTLGVGESTQALASVRDAQGTVLTGRTVAWSTGNPAIAAVSGSGLVTGVAPGTTSIVATSEGRTGQLAVTVSASIAINAFTLRTSTGAPLDTTNVAGSIQVSADIELPPGFRGERVLRIDTVVYARDSVFGATAAARATFSTTSFAHLSAASPAAPFSRNMETSRAIHVITGDELQSTPSLMNGRHLLELVISGQVGSGQPITRSEQRPLHTQNANTFQLFTRPDRQVTLDGGRVIDAGTITGRLAYTAFDGTALSQVEIVRAPGQTVYGTDAIADLINVITLTPPNVFREFSLPLDSYESGEAGTRFLLDRALFGSTEVRPRINPITLGGNRPSLDGSGWATSSAAAANITLPTGVRFQSSSPFPLDLLPNGYFDASEAVRFIDNLAPRYDPGLIAPSDRNYTLGGRALLSNGSLGMSHNYLGAGTTFGDFLHRDKFKPDLSGLPEASDFEWYSSLSLPTLYNTNNRILDLSGLPASSSRTRYFGARARDGAGNWGAFTATTTLGNRYTTGDVVAPLDQIGSAPAIFGKLGADGLLDRTGTRSARVYNAQAIAGSSYAFEGTGSVFAANAAYGVLYDYFDRTNCFRGYDDCTSPAVLGGTFNSSTDVFSYSDPLSSMIAARIAKMGGNGDGVYAARFWAGDVSGTPAIWDAGRTGAWGALIDQTAPTVSGNITVSSPTEASYSVSGADALGVESLYAGIRFDFNNSLFPTGKLFAWLDRHQVPGDLSTGLNTTANTVITGQPYTHGGFFNLATGAPSGSLFKALGGVVQSSDWAYNYSDLTYIDVANPFPEPAVPANTTYHFSTSAATVCRDIKCPVGQSNELEYRLRVRSPLSTAPLHKASFQLIPTLGGRVYHVGTDYEPVTTPIMGGFEHTYLVNWLAATACVAPGLYYIKVMALASSVPIVWFNNPFINLTVTGSSSLCTKPIRPLEFSYPDF